MQFKLVGTIFAARPKNRRPSQARLGWQFAASLSYLCPFLDVCQERNSYVPREWLLDAWRWSAAFEWTQPTSDGRDVGAPGKDHWRGSRSGRETGLLSLNVHWPWVRYFCLQVQIIFLTKAFKFLVKNQPIAALALVACRETKIKKFAYLTEQQEQD